jgi:hypothetical protein
MRRTMIDTKRERNTDGLWKEIGHYRTRRHLPATKIKAAFNMSVISVFPVPLSLFIIKKGAILRPGKIVVLYQSDRACFNTTVLEG